MSGPHSWLTKSLAGEKGERNFTLFKKKDSVPTRINESNAAKAPRCGSKLGNLLGSSLVLHYFNSLTR